MVEDPLLVAQIYLEIGPSIELLTSASCLSQTVTSSFLFLTDWWGCVLWESGPGKNGAVRAPWRKVSEELPSKGADAEDLKLTPCPTKPKYFFMRKERRTGHQCNISSQCQALVCHPSSLQLWVQRCHIDVSRPFLGQTYEWCSPEVE